MLPQTAEEKEEEKTNVGESKNENYFAVGYTWILRSMSALLRTAKKIFDLRGNILESAIVLLNQE